jgi:hypothetical protein
MKCGSEEEIMKTGSDIKCNDIKLISSLRFDQYDKLIEEIRLMINSLIQKLKAKKILHHSFTS